MATDAARAQTLATSRRFHPYRYLLITLIALSLLANGINHLRYEIKSYAVLTHIVDPEATSTLLKFETKPVLIEDVTIETTRGTVPARLYSPIGVEQPHGIVVLPGIHHLGIYDPRFVNFSRALAGSGFVVLTPVLASLADYHVDASSIPTIGESPAWLEEFPDGRALASPAHDYGASVFGYARLPRFLESKDMVEPHEALK